MMICAYCKSRVMESDRKCPFCGSTEFVMSGEDHRAARRAASEEPPREPEQPVYQQPVYAPVYQTYNVQQVTRAVSSKNRWFALLLCVLGGMVGLHRFYTGKIASGVFYLFTGGFGGIGIIIDFFSILFGNFRDSNGLPLQS